MAWMCRLSLHVVKRACRRFADAKGRIRAREQERIAAEQAAYNQKVAERDAREPGKKPRGRKPKRPSRAMDPDAQINLTDDQSRIMPSGDGFAQAYNAQGAVDCDSLLLVDVDVSQCPTDRTLLEPTIDRLTTLPRQLGTVTEVLADAGYLSTNNIDVCERHKITPYISIGRERHAGGLERFREPPALRKDATAKERMEHRLRTKDGRATYGQRKATIEPKFGNIKSVHGFRQFSLRGHDKVRGEWQIMGAAHNLKRMHTLTLKAVKAG